MSPSPKAAVVVAAGASSRLGRPKQTVQLGGETLVERAVRVARAAGLEPVIVVVQDASLVERLELAGAEALWNRRWLEGMATSIVLGVQWAQGRGCEGVVVMTCDQVAVRAEHLRALYAEPGRVTGSRYAGRVGIPAYFPAAVFEELMELKGDVGARELLRGAAAIEDENLALDVDTEEDLRRAKELFS